MDVVRYHPWRKCWYEVPSSRRYIVEDKVMSIRKINDSDGRRTNKRRRKSLTGCTFRDSKFSCIVMYVDSILEAFKWLLGGGE
ncbi:hypothetical protein NDU88_001270 [Pleurodeles waltl]|uniref:Uncharacterized protein n=1 Tax=Pleurodeles waltl TaxID=8319 RepID=A0AAV7Q6K0_PLEWA|nr:hypothetical protein NDU88_001270 [Pleurodeles waltl]